MNPSIPARLEEVILKSLEKDRDLRYQTAAELRGDLKRIRRDLDTSRASGASASGLPAAWSSTPAVAAAVGEVRGTSARTWRIASIAALIALLAGLATGMFVLRRPEQASLPVYHPLTFRRGMVRAARFAPDGKTLVYSAAWEGKPLQLFTTRPESPESHELEPAGADVLGVSSTGEMALSLNSHPVAGFLYAGTLARVPLVGGAPR